MRSYNGVITEHLRFFISGCKKSKIDPPTAPYKGAGGGNRQPSRGISRAKGLAWLAFARQMPKSCVYCRTSVICQGVRKCASAGAIGATCLASWQGGRTIQERISNHKMSGAGSCLGVPFNIVCLQDTQREERPFGKYYKSTLCYMGSVCNDQQCPSADLVR